MPTCPLCLYENFDSAEVCTHCARFRFSSEKQPLASESVFEQSSSVRTPPPRFGDPAAGPVVMPTLPELPAVEQSAKSPTPRLIVIRGAKLNAEFPLYVGDNYLGRTAERSADIDLSGMEPPEQIWSSRQHAVVHRENETLSIEDLNSLNGTFINRSRVHPGKKYLLKNGDVIQIGMVQLRVVIPSPVSMLPSRSE